MQVNYPDYLMVLVRKTTHVEKHPADLEWLLPRSMVWQPIVPLGEGGELGASRHCLCIISCFGFHRAASTPWSSLKHLMACTYQLLSVSWAWAELRATGEGLSHTSSSVLG